MSADVFISYSRVDYPFILAFDEFLGQLRVNTWFDKKSLLPGKKWEDVIQDEISDSKIFLTCMSKAGMDKRGYFHVEQNLAAQAALRIPAEQLFIMPVVLGECDVPRQFKQYHVVNLAEPGAIEMLIISLGEALERQISASPDLIATLRECLLEHLGVEGASNKEFEHLFMQTETISWQDSAGLIERIANSSDSQRLSLLLKLRGLPFISYAEQHALDLAITNTKQGKRTENLQNTAISQERDKIAKMGINGNPLATLQLQSSKYVRLISRKGTPPYEMAQELVKLGIKLGIKGLQDD